jgi:hypothetical protein
MKNRIVLLSFIFIVAILVYILSIMIINKPLATVPFDGILYENIARNLLKGDGLTNSIREYAIIVPPGYPLFIAFILKFFGSIGSVFLFQYLILGLSSVGIFLLAFRIFNNNFVALLAPFLFSIHPLLLQTGPNSLLTESLYIFITIWVFYAATECYFSFNRNKKNNIFEKKIYYFATILTLSLFIRPHFILLMLFVIVFAIFLWQKGFISTIYLALIIAIPVILITSNGLYNSIYNKHFVLFENYSGQNLYIANNPHTTIAFYDTKKLGEFVDMKEYMTFDQYNFTIRNNMMRKNAIQYIISHPLITIIRIFKKTAIFFKGVNFYDTLTFFLFVVGIFLSIIFNKKHRALIAIIVFGIMYYVFVTSIGIIVTSQRYRLPIVPIYLVFSSYTLYIIFYTLCLKVRRSANFLFKR